MKLPEGHGKQPVAEKVPGLVTAPVKPGAQTVHSDTETAPAFRPVVETPYGQGEQPDAFVVPELETRPK